jgi:hypothetical protein
MKIFLGTTALLDMLAHREPPILTYVPRKPFRHLLVDWVHKSALENRRIGSAEGTPEQQEGLVQPIEAAFGRAGALAQAYV